MKSKIESQGMLTSISNFQKILEDNSWHAWLLKLTAAVLSKFVTKPKFAFIEPKC